jgi:hypothetical protein
MDELVRSVAIALNDPQVRQVIRGAITRSPFRENKVDFDEFVASKGGGLLNRLGEVGGKETSAVVTDLGNIYPLQMYFPIKGHLESWDGGTDLLVATQATDASVPVIYNLRGQRVTGLGPREVPLLPTLVLTRREGRFKLADLRIAHAEADCGTYPELCEGGGGGGGGGGPAPRGEWVTRFETDDESFEGLFGGEPEFEITVVPGSAGVYDIPKYRCIGQDFSTSSPRYWDVDDNTLWTGSAGTLDFSVEDEDDYLGTVTYFITENDDDGCQEEFPSIGNPEPLGNDDDEVAAFSTDWNSSARLKVFGPAGHLVALNIFRRYTFDPEP